MEQLFLVGVVLFFMIMDAAGKRARKRAKEEEAAASGEEAATGSSLGHRSRAAASRAGQRPRGTSRSVGSSGEMTPSELWEEIARIARGEEPRRPARSQSGRAERIRGTRDAGSAPAGRVPPKPPVEAGTRRGPGSERAARRSPGEEVTARAEAAMHRAHAEMGKRPSERAAVVLPPVQRLRGPSEELMEIRSILAGGASALRRAVVLEEILGPPAAVRGDPYEPIG